MLLGTLVHVSFFIGVFIWGGIYIPRNGIAMSYGNSIFSFLRNWHIVFHSGWTNLHSDQQCSRMPLSLYSHYRLLFVSLFFLIVVDLQCCVRFWCIAKWSSYTFIYSFAIIFHYGLLKDTDSRTFLLSILYIAVCVC